MAVVNANGVNLYYNIEGSGPPLLLITGMGGHSRAWTPVLPLLTPHYRCIMFDTRGTGRSDVPVGPYTIDELADDTAALIRKLELGPVSVMGVSMGASIAQSLAIRHGKLLERVILVSAFPAYTSVQQAWLEIFLAVYQSNAPREARAAINLAWVYTPKLLSDHERVAGLIRLTADDPHAVTPAGLEAQAHGLRRYDSRAGLPKIKNRTLVLVGAEDVLTPVSQSVEIAGLIPEAELKVLPRGGHGLMSEYTAEAVQAIRAFLDS